MQPVNQKETAYRRAGAWFALATTTGRFFTALGRLLAADHDAERLSGRLRRDAGLDDLEQERKRLARAPLIR